MRRLRTPEQIRESNTSRLINLMSPHENGCWEWLGHRTKEGYGSMYASGRGPAGNGYKASRMSHELFVGPIPAGLQVDHICTNTGCVNPDHLESVTNDENQRRRALRATHCRRGHPVEPLVNGRRKRCGICRKYFQKG